MIDMGYFWTCLKAAISYIPQNLFMSLCTLVICVLLGTVIALARVFRVPWPSRCLMWSSPCARRFPPTWCC